MFIDGIKKLFSGIAKLSGKIFITNKKSGKIEFEKIGDDNIVNTGNLYIEKYTNIVKKLDLTDENIVSIAKEVVKKISPELPEVFDNEKIQNAVERIVDSKIIQKITESTDEIVKQKASDTDSINERIEDIIKYLDLKNQDDFIKDIINDITNYVGNANEKVIEKIEEYALKNSVETIRLMERINTLELAIHEIEYNWEAIGKAISEKQDKQGIILLDILNQCAKQSSFDELSRKLDEIQSQIRTNNENSKGIIDAVGKLKEELQKTMSWFFDKNKSFADLLGAVSSVNNQLSVSVDELKQIERGQVIPKMNELLVQFKNFNEDVLNIVSQTNSDTQEILKGQKYLQMLLSKLSIHHEDGEACPRCGVDGARSYVCSICGRSANDIVDLQSNTLEITVPFFLDGDLLIVRGVVSGEVEGENGFVRINEFGNYVANYGRRIKKILFMNTVSKILSPDRRNIRDYFNDLEKVAFQTPTSGEPQYIIGSYVFAKCGKDLEYYGGQYIKELEEHSFAGITDEEHEDFLDRRLDKTCSLHARLGKEVKDPSKRKKWRE